MIKRKLGAYTLSSVTSLSGGAESSRSSRSTRRSRGSRITRLTTVSLKGEQISSETTPGSLKTDCNVSSAGLKRTKRTVDIIRGLRKIEVRPEDEGYLGARSSVAARGTIVTGRSLWGSIHHMI